jgi:hypothetical protein
LKFNTNKNSLSACLTAPATWGIDTHQTETEFTNG